VSCGMRDEVNRTWNVDAGELVSPCEIRAGKIRSGSAPPFDLSANVVAQKESKCLNFPSIWESPFALDHGLRRAGRRDPALRNAAVRGKERIKRLYIGDGMGVGRPSKRCARAHYPREPAGCQRS
jgi:hypothetical protein